LEQRVVVEDPRTHLLADSLACSAVHLTFFSSSILEASYLGVPSIALDRAAADMFPDQINAGSLLVCPHPSDLNALLDGARRTHGTTGQQGSISERLTTFLERERGFI
jgi:hypothetical protein